MNATMAVAIKIYCESAYPQMREKKGSDDVWIDMLSSYDYTLMLSATKQYIADGNEYAPSIASLITAYKKQQERFTDTILQQMEDDGIFDDPINSNADVASWNKQNRKRKANEYVLTGSMPDWFKALYESYQEKEILKFATNKMAQIGGK